VICVQVASGIVMSVLCGISASVHFGLPRM
jgi:hypothetical protein